MGKAIFILNEMPDCCGECKFCHFIKDESGEVWRCYLTTEDVPMTKLDNCPLRELPERRDSVSILNTMREAEDNHVSTANQFGYNWGWNSCLKVIEGEFVHERSRYSKTDNDHEYTGDDPDAFADGWKACLEAMEGKHE